MIDTNKYEGHTPGPWEMNHWDEKWWIDGDEGGETCVARITNGNKADTRLIAAAPLLLAEVKRLREDNELYLACIHASHFRDKPGSAMSKLNQMRFLQRGEEE